MQRLPVTAKLGPDCSLQRDLFQALREAVLHQTANGGEKEKVGGPNNSQVLIKTHVFEGSVAESSQRPTSGWEWRAFGGFSSAEHSIDYDTSQPGWQRRPPPTLWYRAEQPCDVPSLSSTDFTDFS